MDRARRASPELKAFVFLAVFLFSLGASAQAGVVVPAVDVTPGGVVMGLLLAIAAPGIWRLIARRRLDRRPISRS